MKQSSAASGGPWARFWIRWVAHFSSCRSSARCIARSAGPSSRIIAPSTTQPTAALEGLLFYSGVSGRAYHPDRHLAAAAITAQATQPIVFPAVIGQAYADGFRIFLEMGPGGSCTRLIGRILADRPHLAHSVCLAGRDALGTVLEALANLIACRIPVDLEPLYGRKTLAVGLRSDDQERPAESGRLIKVDLGLKAPGPAASSDTAARRAGRQPRKGNRQAWVRACSRSRSRARDGPSVLSTGRGRGRYGQTPTRRF